MSNEARNSNEIKSRGAPVCAPYFRITTRREGTKALLPYENDTVHPPLICQIARFATSIGANYVEANGVKSKLELGKDGIGF